MAIVSSEIKFYLTGGTGNTDPKASLGGAISMTEVLSGNLNNVFGEVSGDESLAGSTKYRCVAVKNTNSILELQVAMAYLFSNTIAEDRIFIGVQKPASGAVTLVADETTAPAGISFTDTCINRATGIPCVGEGNTSGIGSGRWAGIWLKRVVPISCPAYGNDAAIIVVDGDTAI
jgi:hypothetical protein